MTYPPGLRPFTAACNENTRMKESKDITAWQPSAETDLSLVMDSLILGMFLEGLFLELPKLLFLHFLKASIKHIAMCLICYFLCCCKMVGILAQSIEKLGLFLMLKIMT